MTVARWLLFVPTAFLAYAFMQVLVIALGLLLALPDAASRVIDQVLGTILCPYYSVYIGARVAPTSRPYAAVALVALGAVLSGVILGAVLISSQVRSVTSVPLWWLVLALVIGLVSSIVAWRRVLAEEQQQAPPAQPWTVPIYRILTNIFGMMYVYGYVGQAILFLWFLTGGYNFPGGWWLGIIIPFIPFWSMLLSWYLWALLAVTVIAYFLMNAFEQLAVKAILSSEINRNSTALPDSKLV